MYSRIDFPPGVRRVTVKPHVEPELVCAHLAAASVGDDWFVWSVVDRKLEAVFSMAPNGNGWSPSRAHAFSYLNRACPVNPFELDSIP